MESFSIANDRWGSIMRVALLVAGLSTYFISPDDVVWRFIKAAPNARLLEHVCFGIAAAILGIALLLKMQASADAEKHDIQGVSRTGAVVASLLQAVGIGSLLPLPGFLLLVLGDLGINLLLDGRHPAAQQPKAGPDPRRTRGFSPAFRWRGALAKHIGLCCAFVSMSLFSIVLIDRVADGLFALTALVSIAAYSRDALRAGASHF